MITRPDGLVEASVKGWSATHVVYDYRHLNAAGKPDGAWVRNMSRPILGFMLDFGLL